MQVSGEARKGVFPPNWLPPQVSRLLVGNMKFRSSLGYSLPFL